MNVKEFEKLPVIGILRGIGPDKIEPLTEAVVSSGLKTIEITMNTPGAPDLIRHLIKAAKGRLTVGAGTVLKEDDLKSALDSGATFIVMPTLESGIVDHCVKKKIPVFPGAFTPQEIYRAHESGATMVKVFPAKFLGPAYIKEVKAPLDEVKLLACGGVRPDNVGEFFKSGASAVAFGGSVFKKDKFSDITESIKEIIKNIR